MRNKQAKKSAGTRAAAGSAAGSGPARQVRIIGGQWKRTPLPVLDAEGLRPTPDRVRETLFNWLNHLIEGQWDDLACLDLFAGTGALGFEAASRGAARVVMVEASVHAVRQLTATVDKLQARRQISVVRGDALSAAQAMAARIGSPAEGFGLIFLDPPYHQGWLQKILPVCERLLTAGGLVYAESEQPLVFETTPDWFADWEIVRADKAGMAFYHLLQRKSRLENQA
jgi:16S rRNA (guanine966-N2)-methyltransferase